MEKYYALTIDIAKSRKLSDYERFDVQKKLDDAIKIINFLFKDKIIKCLNFSAGDSVQGLFNNITDTYNAYFLIKSAVFPFSIKAGIGHGKINEFIFETFTSDNSNKYDGEAYHFSKTAIEIAKKTNRSLIIKSNKRFDEFINPLLDDEKFISMTHQRKAIYSLINLINPLINNIYAINEDYFYVVAPLITQIVNSYRKESWKQQSKKKEAHFIKSINYQELEDKEVYNQMKNYDNNLSKTLKNKEQLITVNASLRSLLVNLTDTKEQNINSLIRDLQVNHLRERAYSITKILKYFYEENVNDVF